MSQSSTDRTAASLPKVYQPSVFEPRILSRWDAANNGSGAFRADPNRVLSGERPPYCILIPPPNVTAALHLGHALNNTLQDVLARAHRMMGFETLWLPGTDHAGIATQAVVERRLRAEGRLIGPLRESLSRESFIEQVQAWKDEYEATITLQLKKMGCSCDWSRRRFTMDEQCASAVREAFFRLFRDHLIYRGKRLVNWDPVLQTAVADDECYDEEVDGWFYYLRYPLVHPPRNPDDLRDVREVTWGELAARGYPEADAHDPDLNAWVTVATTRPETYLGDTAVAVNPKDPRAKSLDGLRVQLPLVGRLIPIVTDSYVVLPAALWDDPEEGAADPKARMATGFLKVTPAHDPNDYEIGLRHRERIVSECSARTWIINIMAPDATISDRHGWNDIGDARLLLGLTRESARTKVVEIFHSRSVGNDNDRTLLADRKPYRHTIPHSDRSKSIVEPYLSDQWYCKVTHPAFAKAANAALARDQTDGHMPDQATTREQGSSTLRFYPARYAKTYETWHNNIRDWCISRQLWWGHRIPVWSLHCPIEEAAANRDLLEIAELPTLPAKREDWSGSVLRNNHKAYAADHSMAVIDARGQSWLDSYVCVASGHEDFEARLIKAGFKQDPDVLDTWFSSALWPLSTLGWPKAASAETEGLLTAFNPTSTLCTAREIITLWVSRMVMFNRYFLPEGWPSTDTASHGLGKGPVPFRDVFIHAMIQDGEGRKMSKSLGNGVDPRDIIASHGADAMRYTLVQMTTQTQDVRMPVTRDSVTGTNTSPKFDIGRNVCNKLWNAARFTLGILAHSGPDRTETPVGRDELALIDRWMLSKMARSVRDIEAALKEYQFNPYAQALYDLMWRDFCDWYLEGIKPTVDASAEQRAVLAHALDVILRLHHPVTPFVTEAIWESLSGIEKTRQLADVQLAESERDGLLALAGWPKIGDVWIDDGAEREFEELREIITAVREVRSQRQTPPKRRITIHVPESASALRGRLIEQASLLEALAGIEQIESGCPPTSATAKIRAAGEDLVVSNLQDNESSVAAGAERERLEKRLADLRRSREALVGRLNNPGYTEKAPPALVEQTRTQLEAVEDELSATLALLGSEL